MRRFLPLVIAAVSACSSAPPAPPVAGRGGAPFTLAPLAERITFTGTVLQVLQVPSYTYLEVSSAPGQSAWVATLKKEVAAGDDVVVRRIAEREHFPSRALGRTFDRLVFGVVSVNRAPG